MDKIIKGKLIWIIIICLLLVLGTAANLLSIAGNRKQTSDTEESFETPGSTTESMAGTEKTELSEEEIMIKTDWVKLEKIIYAITENAIKYTLLGKVVLRSFIFNNFAYITVTDTGEGMNQEDIKYLLDK